MKQHRQDMALTQHELSIITGVSRYKIQCAEKDYPVLNSNDVKILQKIFGYKSMPSFLEVLKISHGEENE